MYSNEDTLVNNARIKKIVTVLCVALAISIAALVPTLIFRVQWATDVVSCLCAAFIMFFWSMKLTPLLHYRRFLRSMNNGMSHEMVAEFVSISPDLATHEGVSAHVFEMSEGPKEKGDDLRLFYWDASKPAPDLQPGEMLRVTSHGGFVINWERV
ncbi:MAG: hypothetical protein ACOYIH_07315 [Candidatus Fimadaptatus sp.]|jgi:hypothetical protein